MHDQIQENSRTHVSSRTIKTVKSRMTWKTEYDCWRTSHWAGAIVCSVSCRCNAAEPDGVNWTSPRTDYSTRPHHRHAVAMVMMTSLHPTSCSSQLQNCRSVTRQISSLSLLFILALVDRSTKMDTLNFYSVTSSRYAVTKTILPVFTALRSVVKVVLWSRGEGAHLMKPGWRKPHTHSNPLIWRYLGIK